MPGFVREGIVREGIVHLRRSEYTLLFTSDNELLLIGDYVSRYRLGDVAETGLGPGIDYIQSSCEDLGRK